MVNNNFKQVMSWRGPEEQQKRDLYKIKCANENHYSVIRIIQNDVFYDRNNWLSKLLESINMIINHDAILNIFICTKKD